jgi:YD repeat-containing protein
VPQAVPANPVLKQSVDRWGNTIAVQDASANVTEYRYDAHNQQVQVTAPLVDYLDTRTTFTDATTSDRPRTYNYLDKLGRQIATRDGNGNLMRYYYNAAGQLVTTQNADSGDFTIGSFQRNEYDTFGQVIQSSDELTSGVAAAHIDNLGFRTRNFYDRGGRLTDVWREVFDNSMPPAGTITPTPLLQTLSYGYDENNRRIRETNGMGEVTRYAYDLQGNVILRRTPGLNDTRYTYNVHGAKATEEVDVYTGGVFTRQTWSNDYFGRVRGHVGWTLFNGGANAASFGGGTGASYTYDYNMAGLLYLQRSNEGQRIEFTFDAAGQTTVIRDIAANRQTYITYDTAGRKQRERVVVDGLIHQDTKTDYDAMGRISFVEDPDYRLSYRYDLAGNRTLIHDEFVNHAATRTVEDLYFTYDKMNRVKLGQGVKTAVPATSPTQYQVTMSGPIGAAQGFIYTYNARGDRTSVTQSDIVWTLNGTTWSGVRTSIPNTEKYTYDGLGRLTDVERKTNTGTGFTLYRHNVYDKANRGTSETNYFLEDSAIANRTTVTGYDADGRASTQTTTKGGEYETIVSFGAATLSGGVWSAGYDKAGNLRGYTVKQFDHGHQNTTNPLITTENRFTYELGETFMVSYESARSSSSSVPANQLPKNGDVYREYNADEELVKARDATTLSKSRGYVNNQQGQVLTSVQTDVTSAAQLAAAMDAAVAHSSLNGQNNFTKAQHSFYFNGAMLGTFGQLQPNAQGEFKGNFDVNYTPISEEYPMSTPPTVVAQKGDTLRIIAARIYGDASLWYLLADENALTSPDEVIPEGTSLRVPNNVVSLANSANVYKPYDASKAIGDLSPSQPIPPPPRQHCNMLAMVLIIIVMVVVSIFTAGAAAAAMSPMLGGSFSAIMSAGASAMAGTATGLTAIGSMVAAGIGAAAGSIVSQGLGMALGVQDKFDWKGVATSALSAGIGAGLGAAGTAFDAVKTFAGAHPYLYAAASAATGSALTQGVSVAVKLQDKFSWREVAISAAAAGASEVAGNYAGSRMNHTSMNLFRTGQAARGPLTNFATGIVKGYTTAGVRAAFGGKFDVVQVTADVFGHAIGNAIVEETITHLPSEMKNATAAEKAAFRAAVRAGFSRADSFEMVFNPDVNPYINKRGAMDDSLRAAGVSDVDDLPDDQKANLIDRLYPEGEVDIETIDQPPEPATPREQPSLQTRLGKGLSRVVVGTTDALASLVDTVGPKKFEAGMFLISWGLGGLPKAVVSFTFGQKVEELKQKALAPIKESVSEMIGTYGFDAETAEEYQAVKPASDTVSSVTVGFAFSALLGGGIAGIVQGIKSYRQKQAQALDDRAVLRARQLEQRQNLDGEAGPPISGKSLAAFKRDEIVNMDPKLRPDAATYMTKAELAAHRALFDKGVVKITAGAPNRAGPAGKVLGGPGGTFVLPKDVAEKILKDANGDISKVEKALNLKPGELGKSPVLIDIPHPTGLKMPSGRELGVNSQWVPGGFTANGIPEAVINRVLPGSYTVKPLF